MKNVRFVAVLIFLCVSFLGIGQSSNNYFKVEFDQFTPPVKESILAIEGKPAKNFMIKDMAGKDHLLDSYKGRKVVLWFFNSANGPSDMLAWLSQKSVSDKKTAFLCLINEAKKDIPASFIAADYKFVSLPQAEFLGHAVYDHDLGSPRMYLIDEQGVVKMVLPEAYFSNEDNIKNMVVNFIDNKIR
jgi:hypothetical protein